MKGGREGEETHGVMRRSIRVRKPGWMVHVPKGEGEGAEGIVSSNGWKDGNNEIEKEKKIEGKENHALSGVFKMKER